jgi:hypothetical protein
MSMNELNRTLEPLVGAATARPRLQFSATTLALTLALCVSALVFLVLRPRLGIDDANITLIYARNIATGHGFVYFPGGERVEGSTSLAWTLLCAAAFAVSSRPLLLLFALSAALALVAILAGLELARRASPKSSALQFAALFLLASPAFFAWTTDTLMDLSLWSAAICGSLLLAVSAPTRRRWLGLSLGLILVVLSRPEGMLLAPVLLFVSFVSSALWQRGVKRAARMTLPVGLVVLATIVGLLVFRLQYFGYPVPNTYYVKVGNDPLFTAFRGIGYTAQFLLGNPAYLLAGFATLYVYRNDLPLAVSALRRDNSGESVVAPEAIARLGLSVLSIVGVALPLVEGRDHFVAGRMLQPFVPLFCALMGFQVTELLRDAVRRNVLVGLAAAVLFGWTRFMVADASGFKHELEIATDGRIVGQQLSEHIEAGVPLPTIGVVTAGGTAFAYPGRTLDLLGLNWLRMAHASRERYGAPGHASFSAKVFWSEPASIMVPKLRARMPYDAGDACSKFENRVLDGLFSSKRFRAEYQGFWFAIPEGQIVAYARHDWLRKHRVRDARELDWPTDPAEQTRCSCALH